MLRLPALFTVPGDALAGAAAVGARPNPRTLLAIGSSLCLYGAGMALNDWADRAEDAVERPHRPLPSGRIHPAAALAAAGALTAAGLALAARAGRPSLAVAVPLAATVWAYDLTLKRTPAGPAAMATARGLDVLLGATATVGTAPSRGGLFGRAPAGSAAHGQKVLLGATATVGTAPRRGGLFGQEPTGSAAHGQKVLLGATATGSTAPSRGGLFGRAPAGSAAHGQKVLLGATATGSTAPRRVGLVGQAATGSAVRSLDVVLGATATACRTARRALPSALALATHTLAVTTVSRGETQGSSPVPPLAGLATTGAVAWALANGRPGVERAGSDSPTALQKRRVGGTRVASRSQGLVATPDGPRSSPNPLSDTLRGALTLAYAATSARPLFHAALNPSPPLTQRAVAGGIRAMIPLQAALAARAGAPVTAILTAALAPAARKFARKVSVT
ncbi:hypothetical protein C4B68_06130 [Streptomyces dengpaensis]|uniref:Prenyltransferase n=1 Tax=Streptomyces dengpaensis TaxID=2049881 RepID=A0ABM6T245_9ACTN|nr:hypothetical protein C4B68_06130 [Streptomyces dengpaensis]